MKTREKIIDFLTKYGLIVISIIIAILGLCSIFITAYFPHSYNGAPESTYFKYSIGIIEIILTILLSACIFVVCDKLINKIKNKYLFIAVLLITFIFLALWVKVLKLEPIDDQKLVHNIASALLDGGVEFYLTDAQYLFLYPYQFGIIYFVSIIYRIFGINYMNIEYFNVICSVINIILLYKISKELFSKNEIVQKYLIILLAGFSFYWMFFNVFLYGNIIGLTFALISILQTIKYLNNHKNYNIILAILSIAIAIIVKTNYNIFLCGIVIVLLLDLIKNWNLKKLIIIPVILLIYLAINFTYSIIVQKVYKIDFPDGVPMINFIYMGMSEYAPLCPGWYNGETLKIYYDNECNTEKSTNAAKELISERLNYFWNNPSKFLDFYGKKIGSTWLNPTFQTIWCSSPGARFDWDGEYASYLIHHQKIISMVAGKLYDLEENYFNIYQILIYSFSAIGILLVVKNSETNKVTIFLLPLIFLGGFLFHILWETKAIYVIQYYYLLLPFSAYGMCYSSKKFLSIINKKKKLNP